MACVFGRCAANASDLPDDGTQNLSKWQARRVHRAAFKAGLREHRPSIMADALAKVHSPQTSSVAIYARKRPLLDGERRANFDAVSMARSEACAAPRGSSVHAPNAAIVHDCRIHSDMKHLFIRNHAFPVRDNFDTEESTEEVFSRAVLPVLEAGRQAGHEPAVILFGQTGSGKTHTASGLFPFIAQYIFGMNSGSNGRTSIQCIEVESSRVLDVAARVAGERKPREVQVCADEGGTVQWVNATGLTVSSADELTQAARACLSARSTSSTLRNEGSSRSHGVFRIVWDTGSLVLADLAGAERRRDVLQHAREAREQSRAIQLALFALKECARYLAGERATLQYRASKLTYVLKNVFESCKLQSGLPLVSVIATLSPCAGDAEASVDTLRHALLLSPGSTVPPAREIAIPTQKEREAKRLRENRERSGAPYMGKPPGRWSAADTAAWWKAALVRYGGDKLSTAVGSAPAVDGRAIARWSEKQFSSVLLKRMNGWSFDESHACASALREDLRLHSEAAHDERHRVAQQLRRPQSAVQKQRPVR